MDWIPHFGTGPDLFFTCRAPDQHQFAQYDPPAFQFNMDAVIITLLLKECTRASSQQDTPL